MDKYENELLESVARERGGSADVVRGLKNAERGRRYMKWGSNSLYGHCRQRLGYSEDEAVLRIQVVPLLKAVPEAERSLRAQTLSLSVASMIGRVIKREKLGREKSRELFDRVKGTSKRAAEKTLAELYPSNARRERAKPVNAETTEVILHMTHEEWAMVQELMDLRAHSNFERSPGKLFAQLAREALEKIKRKQGEDALRHGPGPVSGRRPSAAQKRAVWRRDEGKCQFRAPGAEEICGETHGLQVDHIQPWAQGGPTTLENLRLLCGAHNRWRSRAQHSANAAV